MACQYYNVPSICVAINEFFILLEFGFKERHDTGEWSMFLNKYCTSPFDVDMILIDPSAHPKPKNISSVKYYVDSMDEAKFLVI